MFFSIVYYLLATNMVPPNMCPLREDSFRESWIECQFTNILQGYMLVKTRANIISKMVSLVILIHS